MKARSVEKNFHKIIARNVKGGGADSAPPALLGLKIHIRDKWVCGMESNMARRRCPISFCYAIWLNVDWAGPKGKRTIENLNATLDLPSTSSRVEAALFAFSKMAPGKELWESSVEC